MKIFVIAPFVLILVSTTDKCKNKNESSFYKGKLEVKGMCMNYTIKLLEGKIDASKLVAEWKDEMTGKTHNNVFALGSVCNFPPTIKEGDEFSFTIDTTYVSNCAVCLAYYPKPAKSIAIKVVNK
jgi:hypothetical protein